MWSDETRRECLILVNFSEDNIGWYEELKHNYKDIFDSECDWLIDEN